MSMRAIPEVVVGAMLVILVAAPGRSAAAPPLTHLEGALHSAATIELFARIGDEVGTFTLDSSGAGDLRETPGTLVVETPSGGLTAVAASSPRIHGVRRIDPVSARPLRADAAPDAACATGAEPGCWLPPDDPLAQSLAVFDALCDATRGYAPTLDPNACALDLLQSQAEFGVGISLAIFNGAVVSGSNVGRMTTINLLLPSLVGVANAFPTVRVNRDPADGPGEGAFGLSSLSAVTTPEQASAFGCDAYWGSGCDVGGIDLARSEASVVTLAGAGVPGVPIASRNGVAIAGTRGPADAGYDPLVDGCVSDASAGCESATALVHPLTGEPFTSELAALSWNVVVQLVAFSQRGIKPETPCEGAQDPLTCREADEFVAHADFITRADACSYARPDLCAGVAASNSYRVELLDDEPSGAPLSRWLWESGAEYEITAAHGDLAEFLGGAAFVLGPEASRVAGSAIGMPIVLTPPSGEPPASGPWIFAGHGYGYAVAAPEADALALAVASLGAVVAVARRRDR